MGVDLTTKIWVLFDNPVIGGPRAGHPGPGRQDVAAGLGFGRRGELALPRCAGSSGVSPSRDDPGPHAGGPPRSSPARPPNVIGGADRDPFSTRIYVRIVPGIGFGRRREVGFVRRARVTWPQDVVMLDQDARNYIRVNEMRENWLGLVAKPWYECRSFEIPGGLRRMEKGIPGPKISPPSQGPKPQTLVPGFSNKANWLRSAPGIGFARRGGSAWPGARGRGHRIERDTRALRRWLQD